MNHKTYFTSDTHFFHERAIPYCRRPWSTVQEMNAGMIERWNARVGPDDTVYHLGDFAFGPASNIPLIVEQLLGRIILIRGNHDRTVSRMLGFGFAEVHNSLVIEHGSKRVALTHIPPGPDSSGRKYKPELQRSLPDVDLVLCGHVHLEWKSRGNVINVGVDQWNWTPVTLAELETALHA